MTMRFTIKEIDNFNYGKWVSDVILDNDGVELPQSTVCDLLNNLVRENEQLKNDLKDVHKSNHEYYVEINKLIRLCEEFNIDWKKELE